MSVSELQALEVAFTSQSVPASITHTLLALAEFLEHDEKALPIDVRTLGAAALSVGALAKALHYKEMEFRSSPSTCIEALISINNQLDAPEAAVGVLKFAQQQARGQGAYGYRYSHITGVGAALGGWSSGSGVETGVKRGDGTNRQDELSSGEALLAALGLGSGGGFSSGDSSHVR